MLRMPLKNSFAVCLLPSKNWLFGDFPGSPVLQTSLSNAGGASSIPGQGAKIPRASQSKNQNIKQKQHCNKDFKIGLHKKKIFKP